MQSCTIRRLDPREYPGWNKFVLGRRTGTIFQTARWLVHFPNGHFSVQACYDGEELLGGFAFHSIRNFGIRRILPPPLTPYFAPVWRDDVDADRQRLLTKQLLSSLPDYHVLQLTPNPANTPLGLPEPESWLTYQHLTHTIEKGRDEDALMNHYPKQTRYEVRRARRDGLEVVHDVSFEVVRRLSAKSLQHAGRDFPLDDGPYQRLCKELQETSSVHTLAVHDSNGQPIAAQMLVNDSHTAYNILFGIDRERGHRNAGTLLTHASIVWAMEKDLRYDFEGSSVEGIKKFYQKFNPRETWITTSTQPRTRFIRLANALFRLMGRRLY